MEKEIEKIIRENQFSDLSGEELNSLEEWVSSEEEFDVLKQILMTAESLNENVVPSPKLRESLTDVFKAQHASLSANDNSTKSKKKKVIWLRLAISVAAVFVLFMMLFPFSNDNQPTKLTADTKSGVKKVKSDEPKIEIDSSKESTEKKESPIQEPIEGVSESTNQLATANSVNNGKNIESNSFFFENLSANKDMSRLDHSDRLVTNDIPQESRQVIQENPALLDVLYTSF